MFYEITLISESRINGEEDERSGRCLGLAWWQRGQRDVGRPQAWVLGAEVTDLVDEGTGQSKNERVNVSLSHCK